MRFSTIATVLLAVICMSLPRAKAAESDDSAREIAQLRRRVEALQRYAADLERKVQELEQRLAQRDQARSKPPSPRIEPGPRIVPRIDPFRLPDTPGRNWAPRRFNGQPYYIIPLQPDGTAKP
jgi:hypothetical protein